MCAIQGKQMLIIFSLIMKLYLSKKVQIYKFYIQIYQDCNSNYLNKTQKNKYLLDFFLLK